MRLCKLRRKNGEKCPGVVEDGLVRFPEGAGLGLADLLHADDPLAAAVDYLKTCTATEPLAEADLLAPMDQQEIWAAGVTYKRSREARERESVGAAQFYDLVYTAARPELFFKATHSR